MFFSNIFFRIILNGCSLCCRTQLLFLMAITFKNSFSYGRQRHLIYTILFAIKKDQWFFFFRVKNVVVFWKTKFGMSLLCFPLAQQLSWQDISVPHNLKQYHHLPLVIIAFQRNLRWIWYHNKHTCIKPINDGFV